MKWWPAPRIISPPADIFQVVLSHRFSAPWSADPFAFYRSLRRQNPSPYLFYLNFDGFQLAGSSPEILVRLKDGEVTIRPLAGTRARGETPEADKALEVELLADPKERAEHLMLLDLGRNDVGRVAAPGTVEVTESFVVERYSQVMHIVSNVRGKADPRLDAVDTLLAALPAGTLSGAPKVRAMEIIDELESEKRGIGYGGGVGYILRLGARRTSASTLRTALFADDRIFVQAGGRRGRRQRSGRRIRRNPAQGPRADAGGRGSLALSYRQPLAGQRRRRILELDARPDDDHPGHQQRRHRRQGGGAQGGGPRSAGFRPRSVAPWRRRSWRRCLFRRSVSPPHLAPGRVKMRFTAALAWRGRASRLQAKGMILVVDNYDSFTYNLVHYLAELGAPTHVGAQRRPDGGPGVGAEPPPPSCCPPAPARRTRRGICLPLIQTAPASMPILGVCLGHQAIGQAFGGEVIRAKTLMHGKTSPILHEGQSVFAGLPSPFTATRYHSLAVRRETLPDDLEVTAWTADGRDHGPSAPRPPDPRRAVPPGIDRHRTRPRHAGQLPRHRRREAPRGRLIVAD